jgi:ferric iron reductase protein FhuF
MATPANPFTVESVFAELQAHDPKWRVDIGRPEDDAGWILGTDMLRADQGPFHSLLERIGTRFKTKDRMTVAASFALRFGWVASVAIVPCLTRRCVPHVALSNISVKFRENTLFERIAIHEPRGTIAGGPASSPLIHCVPDTHTLLRVLRAELVDQAQPLVDVLYQWSGFSRKGSWGMITSAWASHFTEVCGRTGSQADVLPSILEFFEGSDEPARMKPKLHPVTLRGVTHLYQRRASCCRYYLLPQGDLCASCPLVSDDERIARNLEFMDSQLKRAAL